MKNTNNELSKRFFTGLSEYNLTKEEIQSGDWVYAGGDHERHLRYFYQVFPEAESLPGHEDRCVCNHPIKWNCYIRHKVSNEVVVLGNCCIKKFIKDSGRTCGMCGEPHKNRKDNHCNDCRKHLNKQKLNNRRIKAKANKKKYIWGSGSKHFDSNRFKSIRIDNIEESIDNIEESIEEIRQQMDDAFL